MAPHLLGHHLRCTCPDCGFAFACDPAAIHAVYQLVCPNCGFDQIEPSRGQLLDSPQYFVQTTESPDRFDVIAFRHPDRDEHVVKRILGLPGESVQLVQGDLLVDGMPVVKSPEQVLEQMVQVYDSNFLSAANKILDGRFAPESQHWLWKDNFWTYQNHGTGTGADTTATLSYQHRACFRSFNDPTAGVRLTDFLAYNQTATEKLQPSDQVIAEWDLELGTLADFSLYLETGCGRCEVSLNSATGQIQIYDNQVMVYSPLLPESHRPRLKLRLAWVDGWWTVWKDQSVILHHHGGLNSANGQSQQSHSELPQLGLVARMGDIQVLRFKLFRDLHYRLPEELADDHTWRLAIDEYFVVGDNQTISVDSRHWQHPGLKRSNILGRIQIR